MNRSRAISAPRRLPAAAALATVVLLATAVLLGAGPASAQRIGEKLSAILSDLPADQIPSGILVDRVLDMSGLETRDGSGSAPPASAPEWRQMYDEIHRASLAPPAWPPLRDVLDRARAGQDPSVIPIAVMNFRYERIRPDALDDGALVLRDGRLRTGSGDPYQHRRVFAAAALRDHTYRGGRVVFRFPREDYFSNDPSALVALEADFGDGLGFVRVAFGGERAVSYSEPGTKTLRVRVRLAEGGEYQAGALFEVRGLRTPSPTDTLHIQSTIPYQGGYAAGDAYVDLSPLHTTLTEPVVVLEGFDLDNSMYWDELYALLNRENLLENLRSQGFDLVVLNFTDATEQIQRNAFVAVELIQQVRAAIAPTTDMVLAGASMGGLVGRYALDYMETHAMPHSVRTFLSFDSPQTGADIPLGMQYWLWFFADQSSEGAAFLAALNRPAARQLLAYHYTDPPGATGQPDPLRTQMLNELTGMGSYPSQPRLVAIANGSGFRLGQGFNPGDMIIRWEYTSFLVDITGDVWAVPQVTSHNIFHGLIDYIILPGDEVWVSVTGTRQYDNSPGGWRASMAELGAVDPGYGDIESLHDNHSFIPTISALALDTTDLFYDIAGDPDLLAHTPFDAVYYAQVNEEHVEINARNAPWLMDEITRGATGVAGPKTLPLIARIDPASPNPFVSSTRLRFNVPVAGAARLAIFDAGGRRVAVAVQGDFSAGPREVVWNGRDDGGKRLPAGVYLAQLSGSGYSATRKLVLR